MSWVGPAPTSQGFCLTLNPEKENFSKKESWKSYWIYNLERPTNGVKYLQYAEVHLVQVSSAEKLESHNPFKQRLRANDPLVRRQHIHESKKTFRNPNTTGG